MEKIKIRNEDRISFKETLVCVKLNLKFFLNDKNHFLSGLEIVIILYKCFDEYLYTQGELMLDYYANYA